MTLIDSLVGVASTAVERLTGIGGRASAGKEGGAAGEFANVLASMTGAAPAVAAAAGRMKEMRYESTAEGNATAQKEALAEGDETTEDENALLSLLASGQGATVAIEAKGSRTGASAGDRVATQALSRGSTETLETKEIAANATAARAAAELGLTEAGMPVSPEAMATAEVDDIRKVERDLDELVPEFRRRLDRVVSRMESEFGHEITIVETHRSQERQNFLFEQGRSRPGQVVTWTRDSNHTSGRAADVLIDGSYENSAGYARLGQIAAEEGLRTLGPRDPGHIELPRGIDGGGSPIKFAGASSESSGLERALAEAMASSEPRANASTAQPAGLARVADVARVAEVASLARVAQVARPAEVARPADPNRSAAPAAPVGGDTAAAVFAARGGSAGHDAGSNTGGRRQGGEPALPSAAELELFRADPGIGRTFAIDAPSQPNAATGTDAVQRAAQILALKDGASAAPINHLLLRLDSPSGGEDRIRVDLRGANVGTTLNIKNPVEAERLAGRIGELRQSLERHGLEAESVRVRTTSTISAERPEMLRAGVMAAEVEAGRSSSNSRSGSDSSQSRDAWKESHEQQQLRRESGDPRQRSRREQPQEEKS